MRLENWRHFDFWLLGAVSILVIFSIAMIDSAIAGNIELIENDTVPRQIIFALVGFVVVLVATVMDYHYWVSISKVLYVAIIFFLGVISLTGEASFGAARWLDVGFALIQPSELAKITVIVLLSDFFARFRKGTNEYLRIFRSSLIVLGLVAFIIIQPDLSTSIVLLVLWAALLFASGLNLRFIWLFVLVGLIVPFITFPFLETYQQQRLVNFIAPDQEARFGAVYNVNQALISIGSGNWLGQGYGQGTQVQLRFLKVRHSDFIFSAIAEEFGFVGTVIIMAMLVFIIFRVIRAARMAEDTFGALICFGFATLLGFQSIINIGMNLNLLPVTGLPLPFISQGGSSLLSLMLGIGLVQSVVVRHRT